MFELLDDKTPPLDRMPASSALWRDPVSPFVGLLSVFNMVMYRDAIHTPRIGNVATAVLWMATAVVVWYWAYGYFGRVEQAWRNEPARRTQLVSWTILQLGAMTVFIYALMKNPDVFAAVTISGAIVIVLVQYVRQRRRISP